MYEWRKIWANCFANVAPSPKSDHRMAAEGMQFPWRWNGGTISLNLGLSGKCQLNRSRQSAIEKIQGQSVCTATVFTRHLPDNPQIQGNRTAVPPPRELHPFHSHPMARFWRSALVWKAICPDFPPFRPTPPVVFTWPSISSAYAGAGLRRRSSIRLRIFWNSSLGTATPANWNVT